MHKNRVYIALTVSAIAQPISPNSDDLALIRNLFETVANTQDPVVAKINIAAIAEQYGLSQAEVSTLQSLAQRFGAAQQNLRLEAAGANYGGLGVDRARVVAANAVFDQQLTSFASELLSAIRPGTALNVRKTAKIIGDAIRKSQGAK